MQGADHPSMTGRHGTRRTSWSAAIASVLLIALSVLPSSARAETLIADFSEHIIKINSNFTGKRIHAFGVVGPSEDATPRSGVFAIRSPERVDVIILLKGPQGTVTVRQKRRVAGIWINREAVTFDEVPGYLSIASTRPLSEIADEAFLQRNGLGLEHVQVARGEIAPNGEAPPPGSQAEIEASPQTEPAPQTDLNPTLDADQAPIFREALIRLKRREGLYTEEPGRITVRGGSLFHATLDLPSQVPVGTYTAVVMAIRDGAIVAAQTIPLVVQKDSLETSIYDFAHEQPLLYGVLAVLLAVLVGLGASSLFRRGS